MLEYIPGKYAHRPVAADGYMFIHCIFVGFKAEFKGKGYASAMLDVCINEAKEQGMKGVAVVTRKGSFMAKKDIFVKKGFHVVDLAKPDFELLALKFKPDTADPKFAIPSLAGLLEWVNSYPFTPMPLFSQECRCDSRKPPKRWAFPPN